MVITFSTTLKSLPAAVLIPVAAGDSLDPALNFLAAETGQAARLLRQDFKAEQGEVQILYQQERRFYLLGLGKNPAFSEVLKAFRSFSHKYRQKMATPIAISLLHGNLSGEAASWVEAAINGLLLGAYSIGRFKNKDNGTPHPLAQPDVMVQILAEEGHKTPCLDAAARGREMAQTQMRIFDLVNAPSNKKNPES